MSVFTKIAVQMCVRVNVWPGRAAQAGGAGRVVPRPSRTRCAGRGSADRMGFQPGSLPASAGFMVSLHQQSAQRAGRETQGFLLVRGVLCCCPQPSSTMWTLDSDYSVDWLASDEDNCGSPKRLSPRCVQKMPIPPPPSTTTPLSESPTRCFCSGATQRWRKRSDCWDCKDEDVGFPAALQTPAVSPLSVELKHHSRRKRTHGAGLDRIPGQPQADAANELFLHKCMELQCYIQPLSSILRGLRSGRYSERLSSFQESVAMDRIQRIMGILQNPNMGGRFLSIMLKIEEMLQSWFPHIKPHRPQCEDGNPAKKQKHHCSASPSPSSSNIKPAASCSFTHLKWLHTSPVCSMKIPASTLSQPAASTRCSQEVTQDNAVSSSTDSHTETLHRLSTNCLSQRPLPFQISSPCLKGLLQAKDSIIAPRTVRDRAWLSWLPAEDT
uniref:uncharacterized protein LOC109951246 isoform X2 n=1 Tax=Monopterus albus TaxID=43700 RepID=UPI0009B3500F|nr:uncharacterized protein LOC109951246 isoform X2 [Monopterus albus]